MDYKLTTVGMGEQEPQCGDIRTVFEDCSHVQGHDRTPVKLGCNEWYCPICHYKKAVRESYKANARLAGLWLEAYKYGVDLGRPVHFITSPPKSEYHCFHDKKDYRKIVTRNTKYLQAIGLIGGICVTHAIRGTAKQVKAYKAHQIDLNESWHFHTVGFMPDGHKIDSSEFYASTGWVYKNLPIITKGGARNVIAYELNHAATTDAHHILRWTGITGYAMMRVIEKEKREIKLCQECSADKHRYLEDYHNDRGAAYSVKVERAVKLTSAQLARVAAKVNQPLRPRPEHLTTSDAMKAEKPITL